VAQYAPLAKRLAITGCPLGQAGSIFLRLGVEVEFAERTAGRLKISSNRLSLLATRR
ncbi:uncharacterized protein METZ01_LOCUS398022, partial [marine metagenome]